MVSDPSDVLSDIGRRTAELRAERGLTQEQLAERLGVTVRYLQSIEGGAENLTVESLCKLATVFGVDVRRLLDPPKDRAVRKGRPPTRED